jgi:recombination protein RecA
MSNIHKKKKKEEVVKAIPLNLKECVNSQIISKYGNTVLPTTIVGRLSTGWHAFDRFCPIELGTSMLLWGASQSGKSLMMMKLGASVQELGGLFICFNSEAANRDEKHLAKVVPTLKYKDILFYQPDYIEHTVESIHSIIDMVPVDSPPVFVSIDSINACSTKAEMEAEEFKSKDMSGAEIAAIWSKALRQFTSKLSKKPMVLCLISQMRTGGIGTYRTKDISGGGAAPYYYASTVVKTINKSFLYVNTPDGPYMDKPAHSLQEKAAQECILELQKSRYSSGGSKLEYTIDFNKGIHPCEGLIDMLLYKGIIKQSGAWYSYGDQRLGHGKFNAKEAIANNFELLNELVTKLYLVED